MSPQSAPTRVRPTVFLMAAIDIDVNVAGPRMIRGVQVGEASEPRAGIAGQRMEEGQIDGAREELTPSQTLLAGTVAGVEATYEDEGGRQEIAGHCLSTDAGWRDHPVQESQILHPEIQYRVRLTGLVEGHWGLVQD